MHAHAHTHTPQQSACRHLSSASEPAAGFAGQRRSEHQCCCRIQNENDCVSRVCTCVCACAFVCVSSLARTELKVFLKTQLRIFFPRKTPRMKCARPLRSSLLCLRPSPTRAGGKARVVVPFPNDPRFTDINTVHNNPRPDATPPPKSDPAGPHLNKKQQSRCSAVPVNQPVPLTAASSTEEEE